MIGRYTTQRWRMSGTQNIPSTAALRIFQGRPLMTAAERESEDKKEEQARVKAEREERSAKRHALAVEKAVKLNRKRRDKRRRLKRVSTKAMRTIRKLRLK